jgi:hypothetical protein
LREVIHGFDDVKKRGRRATSWRALDIDVRLYQAGGGQHGANDMVDITNITGDHLTIRDEAITVITGGSADDPTPFTQIRGAFGPGIVQTKEPGAALVARLASPLVKLTRPNDTPVWVKASAVASVRPPLSTELLDPPRRVRSVIMMGGFHQSLREDVATASRLLGIAGAPASA